MFDGLPDACLTLNPNNGTLIYIKRGQSGYYTSNWDTGNPEQNRLLPMNTIKSAALQRHRKRQ